ncbi:hypothetical protein CTI12_AA603590 [Artemisia annua]|uniref:DUF1995 domain-containing protein n=1 Tax=Artemisia annua TaxID=35608 RepID=A0A2U1KHH3_ARTAN|nr:hypothetical protein CTI12_AA603590 [Artemisia annua]
MVHADDGMPYCHVQENFGPWQVMLKQTDNSYACVAESETRFTLNETKEELLRVLGLKEEQGSQLEPQHGGRKMLSWSYLQHGATELNPIVTLGKLQKTVSRDEGEAWPNIVTCISVVVKDEQDIDPNDQNSVLEHLDNVGGVKESDLMKWDKLWKINNKILDPVYPRHDAIVI